uniref:ORF56e n=1 Tax=Pinus koraiensis TaxID=88728 RepID=A4QM97_PINKO|nr:ORF56e [Pinus koraiensis]ABP35434.1 ORF56e [Pinus koraiensis]
MKLNRFIFHLVRSIFSVKRSHGKDRFEITINPFLKSCCSCTSPSRMPQMAYEEEKS